MNRTQTAAAVSYLNRAGLVGAMEGQVAVWHEALEDLAMEDVEPAVREIVRTRLSTERWVTPGDIRAATLKTKPRPVPGTPEFAALPDEQKVRILEREQIREFNR